MKMTNTEQLKQAWFALTDAESCRLISCSLTRRSKFHIEEFDTLANAMPEQEHLRPMTGARGTHHIEEKECRFGSEIIAWLQKKADQYEIDRLVIFARPRMLGVLRMIPLGSLKGQVQELKGDLMRLNTGQLAVHPMVRELIAAPQSDHGTVYVAAVSVAS